VVITCPALNVYLAIVSSVEAEMGGCNYNLKLLNHIFIGCQSIIDLSGGIIFFGEFRNK